MDGAQRRNGRREALGLELSSWIEDVRLEEKEEEEIDWLEFGLYISSRTMRDNSNNSSYCENRVQICRAVFTIVVFDI